MANQTKPRPKLLARYLPMMGWLPQYQRAWLRPDLIAGSPIVALWILEGMGYAQIAGVPPRAALCAAPTALPAFAIFDLQSTPRIGWTTNRSTVSTRSPMACSRLWSRCSCSSFRSRR